MSADRLDPTRVMPRSRDRLSEMIFDLPGDEALVTPIIPANERPTRRARRH